MSETQLASKPKTRISEIPIANEKLYEQTSRLAKMPKPQVRECVEFVGEFISEVIRKGQMQGVMIPYFGKFRPKEKELIARARAAKHRQAGTYEMVQALRGKPIKKPGKKHGPAKNK